MTGLNLTPRGRKLARAATITAEVFVAAAGIALTIAFLFEAAMFQ